MFNLYHSQSVSQPQKLSVYGEKKSNTFCESNISLISCLPVLRLFSFNFSDHNNVITLCCPASFQKYDDLKLVFCFQKKFVILTELSELGGSFFSKTGRHGSTFAKMLTAQMKVITSVLPLAVSQGGHAQAMLLTLGFHLFLVTLRSELNFVQFGVHRAESRA